MTKLEQKLIELGYRNYYDNFTRQTTYYKNNEYLEIRIVVNWNAYGNKIVRSGVEYWTKMFSTQQDIDNLQQAFKQLQSDLEVLKQCQ
jgi:hypothetical protein